MKQRVLVIDDEQNARDALKTILTEEGYEVAEAADGEAGLLAIPNFHPDAVLCDVKMPKRDGLSLLQKVREDGHECLFLMMTAFGTIETAVESMRRARRTTSPSPST